MHTAHANNTRRHRAQIWSAQWPTPRSTWASQAAVAGHFAALHAHPQPQKGFHAHAQAPTATESCQVCCTHIISLLSSSASRPHPTLHTYNTTHPTARQAVASPSRVASPSELPLNDDVGPKDAPLLSLFPPENPPPAPDAPKLKVAIVGSGLAGLSTAVELLDQGYVCLGVGLEGMHRRTLCLFLSCHTCTHMPTPHTLSHTHTHTYTQQEVDIYEQRPFVGGKVASYKDKDGNHIEMGLHVFFGCYFNLFRLMAKCGVLQNLLLKVCVFCCW